MDRKPSAKQPPKSDPTPPRRGRAASVGRDANYTAMAAFARAGFADPALVLHWQDIVGPEVARLARPVKLSQDGTLTLLCEPAAAVFLGHESRSLLSRIHEWAGRPLATRLKFVQGALAQKNAPPPLPRPASSAPPDDPALAYQGPDGLKAALERLARWRTAAKT
jgi:hypothetical protein